MRSSKCWQRLVTRNDRHIPDFFFFLFIRCLSERDRILRTLTCVHFLLGSALVFLKETGLSDCTNDLLTRRKIQMERMTEWSGPIRNRHRLERHRDSNTGRRRDYYLCILFEKKGIAEGEESHVTSPPRRTCTSR